MQPIIDEEVAKMKRKRIIELLRAWSSLIVVVKKKDDKPRFCVHYRNVNEVTESEVTPIRCHKFPPHWINCAEKNLLLLSIYRTDIAFIPRKPANHDIHGSCKMPQAVSDDAV